MSTESASEYEPYLPDSVDVALGCVILYKNILIDATLSVTNTASGYSINNIVDYRSYTKWKSNTIADQTISAVLEINTIPIKQADDVGFIKTVAGNRLSTVSGGGLSTFGAADCIGIFNHNLSGTTITVRYLQNSDYVNAITFTPTSNNPILIPFERQESNRWQIFIDNLTSQAEIADIFLGEAIYFPFRPRAPYTPKNEGIEVNSEISDAGHLLGSVVAHHPVDINPVWEYMSRTWFAENLQPFWDDHAKLLKPFFFGWDLSNRPDDIFYCWVDPAMKFKEVLTTLNYTDEFNLMLKSVNTN